MNLNQNRLFEICHVNTGQSTYTHSICDRDELEKNQIGYAHRGAYTKLSLIIRMGSKSGFGHSVCMQ